MTKFNLIDEHWIPCIDDSGARVCLGVRETLQNATKLQEICHSSPLVTASVHRFLLALLHRTHGPPNDDAWGQLWRDKSWNWSALNPYMEKWYPRFELLDGSRRFYQSAYAEDAKVSPVSKLVVERASGDNKTLFDHTPSGHPLSLGEAACYLIASQAFAVGGLITPKPGLASHDFAQDSHLIHGAVALLRGQSLFETLMLNLCTYDVSSGQPYQMDSQDRPAWEVDQGAPTKRLPRGWLDLLTWQSRRIFLYATDSSVTGVALLKGDGFPEEWHPRNAELMVAYKKNPKATESQDPFPPIRITEGRSLWRDSRSLFASVDGGQPIGMLRFLASRKNALGSCRLVPVDLMGVSKERAKLLLWRHERITLATSLLSGQSGSESSLEALRIALDIAESIATNLRQSTWEIAKGMASMCGSSSPSSEQVRAIQASLYEEGQYWHRLEHPFTYFMAHISGDEAKTDQAINEWVDKASVAAKTSFREIVGGLSASVEVLKATSRVAPKFYSQVRNVRGLST